MRLVKSILHLLEAVCWTHERLVFQTIVLVQCGAKNRASFDDISGENGPKVVGGGVEMGGVRATIDKQNRLRARNAPIGYTGPDTPAFSSWVEREDPIGANSETQTSMTGGQPNMAT